MIYIFTGWELKYQPRCFWWGCSAGIIKNARRNCK